MTTVSVSELYQLSASHSSVVIMSCSKDVLKINERNVSMKAQHLGKLFTLLFLNTHLCIHFFYQAVAWSILLSLSLWSFSLPGSHTSTILGFLEQHTYNTKENLMFQTFFLCLT